VSVRAIVDPSPFIEELLRALAAEHQPRIKALEQAITTDEPAT
jgi:hypothetical protein